MSTPEENAPRLISDEPTLRTPTTLADLIIAEAEKDLGKGEEFGNNLGDFIIECLNYDNPRTRRPPDMWCAGWVSLVHTRAKSGMPRSISAERMRQAYILRGLYRDVTGFPAPDDLAEATHGGAALFYERDIKRRAGHVNMLRRTNIPNLLIDTIGGNESAYPSTVRVRESVSIIELHKGLKGEHRFLGFANID